MRALELDHVGIVGADVEAMRAAFAALGFVVAPAVELRDGDGRSLGQRSAHIALAMSYIELSAPIEGAASHLTPLLADQPRLGIIALRTDDVVATHAELADANLVGGPCRLAERAVEGGVARFRWFPLAGTVAPRMIVAVVEHLTPDLVFASAGFHANRARDLARVDIASGDMANAFAGARLTIDPALPAGESRLTIAANAAGEHRLGDVMLALTDG